MDHLGQFILHHWDLWTLLGILLVFAFLNEYWAQKKRAQSLSPQAVVSLLNSDKAVIIDLRDKEVFQQGHILNAMHAKIDDFESSKMDKYKPYILVLIGSSQLKPDTLATALVKKGFKVAILKGGIHAWQTADLPLVKGK